MSYPPQPPPQPGWPPPPQQPRRKRHTARNVILICAGALVVIIVAAVALSAGKTPAAPGSTAVRTTTPAATPAAAQPATTSAPPHSPTRVRFVVTGTAPGGADITYGSDSDNRNAPGTLGPLGSGAAVPWHGSVPFDGSAQYYAVNAQLESGGDITCKIVVTGPGDVPLTVATGHASGDAAICSAQAAPTDPSGLSWQKE